MLNLIRQTPYQNLSIIGRPDIFLKLECDQFANSFKSRGIIYYLQYVAKINGVVTFTTGNHGIALAAIAKELGIKAIIISTVHLNSYKRKVIEDFGASVQLIDDFNLDYAIEYAKRIAFQNNYTFVPLFNDEYLLEGYSKISQEIFNDFEGDLALYFPIGTGSLLFANSKLAKSLNKNSKIIGMEPKIYQRLNGFREHNAPSASMADSLSIDRIPNSNLALLKYIDGIEVLEEYEIANAISLIFEHFGLIAEPGGAITLAGALKTKVSKIKKIAVITGKNISMEKFKLISSLKP